MGHGPCAGVAPDGGCEVAGVGPCPYVSAIGAAPSPAPVDPAARGFVALQRAVVTDLPAEPLSAESCRACGGELAGATDGCLLGDNPRQRVQLPPSYRAKILAEEGVPAWPGVNCRDRNRVALEGELAACHDVGVAGVHCVTGDHPAVGHRPDAQAVFDVDSTELVSLARAYDLVVSVAHAPGTPPVDYRLPRVLNKVRAGADVVFIDHCGGPERVSDAAAALRDAGFTGPVIACPPVATDGFSAAVLASFAANRLPAGYLDRVTGAVDPRRTGIDEAIRLGERLLELSDVDGVNLSTAGRPGAERETARDLAVIGKALRG
jgi:5,10-methylenetetrahydrofolate reductase